MYNELQTYLRRPALYERTDAKFWNDPHIAEQMLATHLDPTTDLASRKPEFIDRSVKWILSLTLPQKARLLDIGCGPGLSTKRFSEHGLTVTGLDFSETSIAYAQKVDQKREYVLGDYLAMARLATSEEVRRIYDELRAGGGQVLMEIEPTFYAKMYAWVQDKFGASWQLICGYRGG